MAKKRGTRLMGQYTPPKERDPLASQLFAEQLIARMLINTQGLWTSEVHQFDPETGQRMRSRWNAVDDDDLREELRQFFVATLVPTIEVRDKLIYAAALAAANPELAGQVRVYDWDDLKDDEVADLAGLESPQDSPLALAHRQLREQAAEIRLLREQLDQALADQAAAPAVDTREWSIPDEVEAQLAAPGAEPAPTTEARLRVGGLSPSVLDEW